MAYFNRVICTACFCLAFFFVQAKAGLKPHIQSIERNKTMSNYLNQKKSMNAFDKRGNAVTLEWEFMKMFSPEFCTAHGTVADFAIDAFTSVEMQFLRKHPEVVGKEPYFKSFEPLFKDGFAAIDWQAVKEAMQLVLKGHFVFDATHISEQMIKMFENDIIIFVTIKDTDSKDAIGYASFMIRENFELGSVKLTGLAVKPSEQNRGLAKLLMSSIFKFIPDIKRIFLSTRRTNDVAIRAYRHWGFEEDLNPLQDPHYRFNIEHWIFMEYKANQKDILQRIL